MPAAGGAYHVWNAWFRRQASLVVLLQWQLRSPLWFTIVSFLLNTLYFVSSSISQTIDSAKLPCILTIIFIVYWSRFSERGKIFAKQEIRSIQVGPGGLFFTGDGTGQVKVWQWWNGPAASAWWPVKLYLQWCIFNLHYFISFCFIF